MKKKVLAALMAMLIVFGVAGCGSDSGTSASSIPPETRSTESLVEESEVKSTESPETERPGEETEEISEESTEEESSEVEDDEALEEEEISGLIIMTASRNPQSGVCNVSSFDPENGEVKPISNFHFSSSSDISYFWIDTMLGGYYQFDSTYARMTTRKYLLGTNEEHAGWLTTDGEFFDVTEAIGWDRQSDFDAPVHSASLGFTDNDLFIFSMIDPDNRANTTYYSVPVSDVTIDNVQECHVSACSEYPVESYSDYHTNLLWEYGKPTSWIDGTHCILTPKRSCTSVILNLEDKTLTEYIPGDSRNNWSGYVSPDGTRIAFTSVPKNGNEKPDIFIVSIDGGDPVRVAEHNFVLAKMDSDFESGLMNYTDCTILIGWR